VLASGSARTDCAGRKIFFIDKKIKENFVNVASMEYHTALHSLFDGLLQRGP